MNVKRLILLVVMLGSLMSAIDSTIVILSLPVINYDLGTTLYYSIWIILTYLLILSIFTTQLGSLGQTFGRGRIYNLGFAIFTLGSLLAGLSINISFLIYSRIIQAFGAAMMQANGNAIISDYFDIRERGKAFGYITTGWNIGAAIGILLGGIITTFFGWRFIFFINVPIGAFALFLGIKYLKDNEKTASRIDIPGMVTLGTSLGLLSYAAIDISSYGLNIRNSLELLLSISLWIPFYFLEKRMRSPLINFEVFREKHLLYSLLASFTQALGYLAVVFLLIMYLQGIRGFNPLIASIILLPGYILSSIMAPYMGKMADSKGPKNVATLGILLMALGVVLYAMLDSSSPVIYVSLITLITGLGAAMFWPSNNKAIMSSSPKQYYGVVSGVVRTLGSIGTLLSYVIAITVSSLAVPRYLAFQVFLGTNKIEGGLTETFLEGLRIAFLFSFVLLISAGTLSYLRGDSNYE